MPYEMHESDRDAHMTAAMKPIHAPPRSRDQLFQRFLQVQAELGKMGDEMRHLTEAREAKAHELLKLLQEVKAVSDDADETINKVIGHWPTEGKANDF